MEKSTHDDFLVGNAKFSASLALLKKHVHIGDEFNDLESGECMRVVNIERNIKDFCHPRHKSQDMSIVVIWCLDANDPKFILEPGLAEQCQPYEDVRIEHCIPFDPDDLVKSSPGDAGVNIMRRGKCKPKKNQPTMLFYNKDAE